MTINRTGAALILAIAFCISGCWIARADLSDFAFQPHPGAHLPLATTLSDAQGRTVALGSFFNKRPVILVLEYLRCRSLCGVTLRDIIVALRALPFKPGRDFEFLAISIDPRDTPGAAAAAAANYEALYSRKSAARLHFLVGDAASVHGIAAQIGFPYRYDRRLDMYIHPAGFLVATPEGDVSSYVEGVAVTPTNLVKALADAEQEKHISPLTRILLFCHVEGAPLGRFTVPVLAVFTTANIAAGTALIVLFAIIRRRG